ncbi:Hpt domain-containing protein [Pacificimonas pallii]|nr:Hpt domain-containing protein [Pacificimonas pallii]
MGARFINTIKYFLEDGAKAVSAIEEGQRGGDAAAMVLPAHTLKTEARQLGAYNLGDLCDDIEQCARHLVETQERPDDLLTKVAQLRAQFRDVTTIFQRETNPLQQPCQKAVFGRAAR